MSASLKPVEWVGSALEDLQAFPEEVRQTVGYALYLAQWAVYTVRLAGVIYVLHAFQKKSKQGIATPKQDIELISARLKRAQAHYSQKYS